MTTHAQIKQFLFSYASAVIILILLLAGKQALIQITLAQTSATQYVETTIVNQEIRTQRILHNALLLLTPGNHTATLLALYSDDVTWEATQDAIIASTDFEHVYPYPFALPRSVQADMQQATPSYKLVRTALRDLLHVETTQTHPDQKIVLADETTIFYQTITYVSAFNSAETELLSDASNYITTVQWIELGMFSLALLTIAAEVLFAFRPALRELRENLRILQAREESKQ